MAKKTIRHADARSMFDFLSSKNVKIPDRPDDLYDTAKRNGYGDTLTEMEKAHKKAMTVIILMFFAVLGLAYLYFTN